MLDRKTQSVIDRLKEQSARKRGESKPEIQFEREDSTLERGSRDGGDGQRDLVHKLTEDLRDLTIKSRAVIPAHRSQLTSPRVGKTHTTTKREFVTPKIQ